jgi:4-amino-4-deoxy-L-arabinose transferase-like glycosyltransferase
VLVRISIRLLDVSEFTLRLPTVVAAAGFFTAAGLVCRRVFGSGGLSVIAAWTVVLNPYVLDFMSQRAVWPWRC